MVPRRLSPWTACACWSWSAFARRRPSRPRSTSPERHPGLQPGHQSQRRRHAGEQQSAEHRPVAVDHRQRLGLGMEHPGHPDVLRFHDGHALRRHQHVRECQRSVRALRPGQWRPLRLGDRLRPRPPGRRQVDRPGLRPGQPDEPQPAREPRWSSPACPPTRPSPAPAPTASPSRRYNATKAANERPGLRVRHEPAPVHGQPGLRSHARPIPNWSSRSRTSARSPASNADQRVLDLGVRRLEPVTASPERPTCPGRRSRPMPSRTSPSRRPGWPGRSSAAGGLPLPRGRRSRVRGLRFDPSNQ